jgi:hypothetical protein
MPTSFTVTFLLDVAVNFGSCDSSIEGGHLLATATAAAAAPPTTTATAPTIAAAPLKVLEALALLSTPRPILRFALHVLHFGGRTTAGTVIAAFTGAVVASATTRAACFLATSIVTTLARSISGSVSGAGPLLRVFCPAPIGRRRSLIHRIPASIVVLLPTITGILINITVVPRIHVATGGFAGCSVSPGRARAHGFAALRP